jgi:hypothetical protein
VSRYARQQPPRPIVIAGRAAAVVAAAVFVHANVVQARTPRSAPLATFVRRAPAAPISAPQLHLFLQPRVAPPRGRIVIEFVPVAPIGVATLRPHFVSPTRMPFGPARIIFIRTGQAAPPAPPILGLLRFRYDP